MPDYLRRRLLAAMATSPLWLPLSVRAAESTPDRQRIAVLDWLPVEPLLALGVMPMAVSEIHNYRIWVDKPELAADTIDLGLRTEPNLELLTQLQPSLILYYRDNASPEKLARIAPAMDFVFSGEDGKPLTAARKAVTDLGLRLGLEQRATQHLAEFDTFIAAMRARLSLRERRPLLLMSLLDSHHAMVFGRPGLFHEVLELLGLENAWQEETGFWGSSVVGLERLANIKDVDVICFGHDDDKLMAQVSASPLWQSFAFVRQQRFKRAPAVWFYGATLTAMHLCRVIAATLEA